MPDRSIIHTYALAGATIAGASPPMVDIAALMTQEVLMVVKIAELFGEKIDIINWSDEPGKMISAALSPAEVVKVEIEGKNAKVYINKDQQSIAIGRQGQNVRLASKLTGYEIDILVAEAPKKKARTNVEDSLLDAISEAEDSAEESAE